MSDPVIQVEGLSKRYRLGQARTLRQRLAGMLRAGDNAMQSFWALRDVSFSLEPGRVLGVIGHNGAGKSTLLKLLSRITDPTEGKATIRGRVASLLEVGTGFHPELSGRENIYLNGAILGMKREEITRKLDEIVAFAEVGRFLDTPVKRYSSGMYVRLAFAIAAHLEPEVLIIDEVLAVGDATFQRKCLGKMGEVAGHGRAVIFVSHNMSAVQSLTSRCVWLDRGLMRQVGPSGEVANAYLKSMETVCSLDTDQAPRHQPNHGKTVRICRIDPTPHDKAGFQFGEPIGFDICLKSSDGVEGLRVGVTIRDPAGSAVLSTFSPRGVEVEPGGTARYHIDLHDHRLAPGAYHTAFSVCSGDPHEARYSYDVIHHGPSFIINSVSHVGEKPVFVWPSEYGPIVHEHTRLCRMDNLLPRAA